LVGAEQLVAEPRLQHRLRRRAALNLGQAPAVEEQRLQGRQRAHVEGGVVGELAELGGQPPALGGEPGVDPLGAAAVDVEADALGLDDGALQQQVRETLVTMSV